MLRRVACWFGGVMPAVVGGGTLLQIGGCLPTVPAAGGNNAVTNAVFVAIQNVIFFILDTAFVELTR